MNSRHTAESVASIGGLTEEEISWLRSSPRRCSACGHWIALHGFTAYDEPYCNFPDCSCTVGV